MKYKIIILIISLFAISRFFAFSLVYHQDEYKWAMLVNPQFNLNLESDHPPLVGILYGMTGTVFGFSHLRLLPIFVSILNFILIYLIAKKMYGKKAAIWTSGILIFSVYYLIASTQVDIDGALLPFFGLLSIYSYYKTDFRNPLEEKNRIWFAVFLLSIVGGFLIKLSFSLFVLALGTEYFLTYKPKWKEFLKVSSWIIGAIALSGLCAFILNEIFGIANSSRFLENTTHFSFFNLLERNYSQIMFLTVKSFILASPLILSGYAVGLWGIKNIKKYRLWLIYFFYNIIFYYVVFDFSNRTLERYLMFLIIPGAIMIGSYIAEKMKDVSFKEILLKGIFFIVPAILLALFLFSLPYQIFPLNPKSAYIESFKSLHLNFLLPITGGSGPVGMYVLCSFILCFFAISAVIFLISKSSNFRRRTAETATIGFITLGLVYNVILVAELTTGFMYGNANTVVKETTAYVNNNSAIKEVITYYDIAGYELNNSGKYARRFYTDPMFEDVNVTKFANYKGYFMVVDFPEIDKKSIYWKYFRDCNTVKTFSDKTVYGYVFDCKDNAFKYF